MISRTVLATALALAPCALGAETGVAPARIGIKFEADAAVATGITPGATVVWLGASRGREEWSDHFYHWRLTTEDSDKDGAVSYPRKEGFPRQTVLVAVDLTTGAFAVGATYPLDLDVPPPDFGGAVVGPTGLLTSFAHRSSRADILVVRAGAGVWAARILDGGPLDEDGIADGSVTIGLAALSPHAGKAGRLDGIRPGDVVAMADPAGPSVRVVRYPGKAGRE